jgi:hypothetical protein
MKQDTLKRKLSMALSRMLLDEWRLLSVWPEGYRQPVSERAVAFQLGWYLRPLMDRRWDVDCEYNRSRSGEQAEVKHTDQGTRSPDLIVHRRGMETETDNLLVLELKTNTRLQRGKGGSIESVRDLMMAYRYQHGVLLDLGISYSNSEVSINPQWIWLEAPAPVTLPVAVPVYNSPATLDALIARAREEERFRYSIPPDDLDDRD